MGNSEKGEEKGKKKTGGLGDQGKGSLSLRIPYMRVDMYVHAYRHTNVCCLYLHTYMYVYMEVYVCTYADAGTVMGNSHSMKKTRIYA